MSGAVQRWLMCASRGERFGLDLRWVRQIDYHPEPLALPTAAPPLAGLMSWRERQVPAISLDLALGHREAGSVGAALMLEVSGELLGLLVEEAGETFEVSEEGIYPIDRSVADGEGLVTEAVQAGPVVVFRLNAEKLPSLLGAASKRTV